MAFSTLSSVNSIIKYKVSTLAPSLTPSIWYNFDPGSTFSSSSITNSGILSGLSYSNNTSNASLNTSTYKYGGGSLYVNYNNTISTITGLTAPSSVSICFWVNFTTPSSIYRLFYFCNLNIFIWPNSGVNYLITWCNSNWMLNFGDVSLTSGTWTHIGLTFTSSGGWVVYINGTSVKTGTYTNWSSQFSSVNTFLLFDSYGYVGYIDDIRIFNNIVLRSDQITAIYNNTTVTT